MARRPRTALVVAGRLSAARDPWQDTHVELPEAAAGLGATDVFTGRELRVEGRALKVAEAMATLPLAVYKNASAS